ncbi:hypothetical protein CDAR_253761 [Caerostris darwini]|uniref:Uncharacterized protein n=1 Tax=Caerostris darwini TaxID=1538125 RepID=A0AAV4Q7B7_9ARAC|nr:hypothetical protein CDAR_253761 [Caerostris darwini]
MNLSFRLIRTSSPRGPCPPELRICSSERVFESHRSILFAEDYGIMTHHCGSSKTLGGMTRLLELKS